MAKVYDIPTYVNQTKNVLGLHLTFAMKYDIVNARATISKIGIDQSDAALYAILGNHVDMLNEETWDELLVDEYLALRQAYESGFRMRDIERSRKVALYGGAIHNIITSLLVTDTSLPVLTDQYARFALIGKYLGQDYVCTTNSKEDAIDKRARIITNDVVIAGIVASMHGENVRKKIIEEVSIPVYDGSFAGRMKAFRTAIERLKMSSMTNECVLAHTNMEVAFRDISSFDCSETYAGAYLGCTSLYRIGPLFIIAYIDAIYILDHASIVQSLECAVFWEGCSNYGINYRICGDTNSDRTGFRTSIETTAKWISHEITDLGVSRAYMLPRFMKQAVHRLMNSFHLHKSRLDVKANHRDIKLKDECRMPNGSSWYDQIKGYGLNDRAEIDISYIFHGLPAPDCDLRDLFSKTYKTLTNPATFDKAYFKKFMDFCKACDLARAVFSFKGAVTYASVENYHPELEKWWDDALRSPNTIPPEDHWGKSWIHNHFTACTTTEGWFWSAGDVTRVSPETSIYATVEGPKFAEQYAHNELLWALKKAPILANGWDTLKADHFFRGDIPGPEQPVLIAAKNENTKFGIKVRGRWSADHVTREVTSLYDQAAVGLASLYGGVTSRKSFRETETTYNNINDDILSHKYKILISNDAKGWSDVGPRCAWAEHHDYVFQTIKNAPNVRLENLWKNTRATINKRGYVNCFNATATMFQGFTGTMDSLLNDRITLFAVREARKLGLLGKGGYVRTAALIDDAIQAIFMPRDTTFKSGQKLADHQFDITANVWKKLGAELDDVKTMVSDTAFVYLNRFFCEGTEVLTPMKVYSKADREFTRRYATVVESIDTILGSYRAAVGRGGDPLVCYKMCIYKSVRLILKTNHEMMYVCMSKFINTCFAPRGFGGMGIPVMTAFLTNECKDDLTSYLAAMCMTSNVMRTERWAKTILDTTSAVIEQRFAKDKYASLACNPRAILADGVPDPGSAVRSVLKKSLLNFAESPIFREILGAATCSVKYYEFITKSGIWDANILEAFPACLPNRVEPALLARASESEILVKVCSYRERRYMGRILRERNRDLVGHIKKLQLNRKGSNVSILSDRSCSTDVATKLRDAYYQSLDVNIVNHTLPAYASCYARIDIADNVYSH